jgi:hypothetical protein
METMRSIRLFKILSCLAILVWVLMMGALFRKTYIRPVSHKISWSGGAGPEVKPGEQWMGIYFHDRKIGYAFTGWEKEGLGLRLQERTVMELMVMGQPQTVNLSTQCLLDSALQLKSFRFLLTSDRVNFQAEGEVKGKGMEVRLSGVGENKILQVPLDRVPFLWPNLRFLLKDQNWKEGQSLRVPLFDPATLNLETLTIRAEGKERLRIGKEEIQALRLSQSFRGITVRSWIGPGGELLKEESPLGFVMVREEKEAAILKGRGTGKAEDVIAATAVPSRVKIPNPGALRVLRLGLGDLPREGLDLEGGRQRLRGNSLEIWREELDFEAPRLPLRDRTLEPYLQATPFIQCDHPELKQFSASILRGEKDSLAAAKALAAWVFENVEKRPVLSIPSSLEVLHSRVGDCNEHTVLFTGLARAAGLPARMAAGLVYVKGNFYYHAWPEIYAGRWIAIDPTLNQFPADATHVRLVEGGLDRQAELARVIGKVKLEVLGFR